MTFKVPEEHRMKSGPLATDWTYGRNGCFIFPSIIPTRMIMTIASDGRDWPKSGLMGEPWEHVSVHCSSGKRQFTPTWVEMAMVKDMFWDEEDAVIQIHPPKSDYINNHLNTLHLWRPTQTPLLLPPAITVGIKDLGVVAGER